MWACKTFKALLDLVCEEIPERIHSHVAFTIILNILHKKNQHLKMEIN